MKTDTRIVAFLINQLIGNPSGRTTFTVSANPDRRRIAFTSRVSKGEQYSRKCTYRKNDLDWRATVQSNWNRHVHQRCANLRISASDGLSVILFMAPVGAVIDGNQIFRTVALRKGRGFSGVIEHACLGVCCTGPRVWKTWGSSPRLIHEKLQRMKVRHVKQRFALAA